MGEKQDVPGQRAQIVGQVVEKAVSGTNLNTTIKFDNLEADIPEAKGSDGRDLGGATWKLNGKIIWTAEAHKDQGNVY
jgi:hypothetical protein